jgi:hypothetical protein
VNGTDGVRPRVGLVVHVHPASDRRAGLAALEVDVETVYAWGRDWLPPARTLAEKAAVISQPTQPLGAQRTSRWRR